MRLTPYTYGGRVLLDIAQVIPLREAEELTIKLRRRETATKSSTGLGKDCTRFRVTTPAGTTAPLAKRRAMLHLVRALAESGVPPVSISAVLPNAKFLDIDGEHTDRTEIINRFVDRWPNATADNIGRWFVDDPIIGDGKTWLLSSQWGRSTETALKALAAIGPSGTFLVEAVR